MKGRIFLFQWDKTTAPERAARLRADGWEVEVESEDGARDGKKVLAHPPELVVLDLARRPSHSRETAQGLRGYKAGRNLPILFVDGKEEDIQKSKSEGTECCVYDLGRSKDGTRAVFKTGRGVKKIPARNDEGFRPLLLGRKPVGCSTESWPPRPTMVLGDATILAGFLRPSSFLRDSHSLEQPA